MPRFSVKRRSQALLVFPLMPWASYIGCQLTSAHLEQILKRFWYHRMRLVTFRVCTCAVEHLIHSTLNARASPAAVATLKEIKTLLLTNFTSVRSFFFSSKTFHSFLFLLQLKPLFATVLLCLTLTVFQRSSFCHMVFIFRLIIIQKEFCLRMCHGMRTVISKLHFSCSTFRLYYQICPHGGATNLWYCRLTK